MTARWGPLRPWRRGHRPHARPGRAPHAVARLWYVKTGTGSWVLGAPRAPQPRCRPPGIPRVGCAEDGCGALPKARATGAFPGRGCRERRDGAGDGWADPWGTAPGVPRACSAAGTGGSERGTAASPLPPVPAGACAPCPRWMYVRKCRRRMGHAGDRCRFPVLQSRRVVEFTLLGWGATRQVARRAAGRDGAGAGRPSPLPCRSHPIRRQERGTRRSGLASAGQAGLCLIPPAQPVPRPARARVSWISLAGGQQVWTRTAGAGRDRPGLGTAV